MPRLFSDHLVLQAYKPIPIWGTANSNQKITVTLANQSKVAEVGSDGKWTVTLDPLPSAENLTLQVQGENSMTITDVMIGEVWVCSGQSNMALPVSKAKDFDKEQPAANWPKIRMFTDKWIVCSPETVKDFSAVGYFFAREIHQKLGSPVGLIFRASGGTLIELWTDAKVQKNAPELSPLFKTTSNSKLSPEDIAQAEVDRQQALEVEGKNAASATKKMSGYLFESRITPLIPFAIQGVLWYQGEANSYTSKAYLYGAQLSVMINDWRTRWGNNFWFISVQLPELGKEQSAPVEESGRAWVREGVFQSLKLPHTGMAVTLGTGEAGNNHPKNKQDVGRRLALWALSQIYNKTEEPASGPLFAEQKIEGKKMIVTFNYASGGLSSKGGELKGFAIAGKDGQWRWANATIEGNTVILSHPELNEPVAVRYAWAGNPNSSNLVNGAGLPASPFRTDNETTFSAVSP
ncbi:MAG: sialate O-acetylesterase [Verrucomicrobiota bacterium]